MENKLTQALEELTINKNFVIGNDLVFIPHFQNSLTDVFKKKVYTNNELAYCELFDDSLLRYASTWAAKEAVYKAIKQLNNDTLSWKKIEITREKPAGRPHVIIHQYPEKYTISLTLSHDGDYVWAIALIGQVC